MNLSQVVGPEATVNGTPLVSRMDGLYAQNHMQSLPELTYQQMLDPAGAAWVDPPLNPR